MIEFLARRKIKKALEEKVQGERLDALVAKLWPLAGKLDAEGIRELHSLSAVIGDRNPDLAESYLSTSPLHLESTSFENLKRIGKSLILPPADASNYESYNKITEYFLINGAVNIHKLGESGFDNMQAAVSRLSIVDMALGAEFLDRGEEAVKSTAFDKYYTALNETALLGKEPLTKLLDALDLGRSQFVAYASGLESTYVPLIKRDNTLAANYLEGSLLILQQAGIKGFQRFNLTIDALQEKAADYLYQLPGLEGIDHFLRLQKAVELGGKNFFNVIYAQHGNKLINDLAEKSLTKILFPTAPELLRPLSEKYVARQLAMPEKEAKMSLHLYPSLINHIDNIFRDDEVYAIVGAAIANQDNSPYSILKRVANMAANGLSYEMIDSALNWINIKKIKPDYLDTFMSSAEKLLLTGGKQLLDKVCRLAEDDLAIVRFAPPIIETIGPDNYEEHIKNGMHLTTPLHMWKPSIDRIGYLGFKRVLEKSKEVALPVFPATAVQVVETLGSPGLENMLTISRKLSKDNTKTQYFDFCLRVEEEWGYGILEQAVTHFAAIEKLEDLEIEYIGKVPRILSHSGLEGYRRVIETTERIYNKHGVVVANQCLREMNRLVESAGVDAYEQLGKLLDSDNPSDFGVIVEKAKKRAYL